MKRKTEKEIFNVVKKQRRTEPEMKRKTKEEIDELYNRVEKLITPIKNMAKKQKRTELDSFEEQKKKRIMVEDLAERWRQYRLNQCRRKTDVPIYDYSFTINRQPGVLMSDCLYSDVFSKEEILFITTNKIDLDDYKPVDLYGLFTTGSERPYILYNRKYKHEIMFGTFSKTKHSPFEEFKKTY